MRAITTPGRWVWGLSGLVTAVALAVPGTRLIASAGLASNLTAKPQPAMTRTLTIPQPVTSLDVQSYGDPVQVTAGPVRRVQVTETIGYGGGWDWPPAVTQSVTGGHLTLADPACADSGCDVAFSVTVPSGVTVTAAAQGGDVTVSGVAGANLDSGGGQVDAAGIDGPLTVKTEGGMLRLDGLAGALSADTGGGDLIAQGVAATAATVTTSGGNARIAFAATPDAVTVSTDGGAANLTVPGGPYAVTADSGGGGESVGIATNPAAHRSIAVSSGGGPLLIGPSAGALPAIDPSYQAGGKPAKPPPPAPPKPTPPKPASAP
jgi:hypothetical protein